MQDNAPSRNQTVRVVVAFACVYLFWGSAFVAIRYSAQLVHPAFVAGIRYLIAGVLLLAFVRLRGDHLRLGRRDLVRVTGLGLLMFTCNTMLLSYGGKALPAGLTALLISTIPLFIALIETLIGRRFVTSVREWGAVCTGFLGVAMLLRHTLHEGLLPAKVMPAALGLLAAALAWALGSVLLSRMKFEAPTLVCTSWQMLIGGTVDVLIGGAVGGLRSSQWSMAAWGSLIFLAVCGTLIGFTAYSYLLRRVSIGSVATYAYINPLVAVVLGWLLLGEQLSASQWVGLVIVLGSVAIVVSLPQRQVMKDIEASGT